VCPEQEKKQRENKAKVKSKTRMSFLEERMPIHELQMERMREERNPSRLPGVEGKKEIKKREKEAK